MKVTQLFILIITILFASCMKEEKELNNGVIPQAFSVQALKGNFHYTNKTEIIIPAESDTLKQLRDNFIVQINSLIASTSDTNNKSSNSLYINIDPEGQIPLEGYTLSIERKKAKLTASSCAGIFYGLQSLSQLIHLNTGKDGKVMIPAQQIEDFPRFSWRGMHLDVARHFIPVEDVKKYLDYMALYKFNKFHWHLTEDQGWRIEIKKYPLLTEKGAWRTETLSGHISNKPLKYDNTPHGGFYTQEEVKEIIDYASARFIEVIPEIEMPGHARAAIAAYPWLGVTGEKVEVKKEWGISPYIYMPSKETFSFLEDVLTEVIELFPSSYIHIGGDEAIKDQWEKSIEVQKLIKELNLKNEHELQSWFIQKMEQFLNEKGKKLIGWDEILEGGLAPNATVMSWRGVKGGIEAAEMGHDVIMSPTSHCYFDYYQAKPTENEPLAIGGYLPLEKVYSYEPVPENLSNENKKHILGAQANVWTEYIPDMNHVEYMIFPRMLAMSEVTWSLPSSKSLDRFLLNVNQHEGIFHQLGVNYSKTGMPGK